MAVPLDKTAVINILRETALASTIQITKDDPSSIFGKLYSDPTATGNLNSYFGAFRNLYSISQEQSGLSISPPIPVSLDGRSQLKSNNETERGVPNEQLDELLNNPKSNRKFSMSTLESNVNLNEVTRSLPSLEENGIFTTKFTNESLSEHASEYSLNTLNNTGDSKNVTKTMPGATSPKTIESFNSEHTIDSSDEQYAMDDNSARRNLVSDIDIDIDGNSVVDSIESSELADSDYDYFNPDLSLQVPDDPNLKNDTRLLHNTVSPNSEVDVIDSDFADDDDDDDDDDLDDDDYEAYAVGLNGVGHFGDIDGVTDGSLSSGMSLRERADSTKTLPNSIARISFLKRRPDRRASVTVMRRKSEISLDSSASAAIAGLRNVSKSARRKTVKSFNNLQGLAFEKRPSLQSSLGSLEFKKIDVYSQVKNETSKLSSLINKKDISLEYYKYVTLKQNADDVLGSISIYIPAYGISLEKTVNFSCQVVEIIGYVLYVLQLENKLKDKMDSKYWKLYLGDDGEIEDDFGVLDRKRQLISYGADADEFVLVECDEKEIAENDRVTPSPLEHPDVDLTINDTSVHDDLANSVADDNNNNNASSQLTPTMTGLTLDTLFSGTVQPNRTNLKTTSKTQKFVLDDTSSDEDNTSNSAGDDDEVLLKTQRNRQKISKDVRKYTYLKNRVGDQSMATNNSNTSKALDKFKTKTTSRTIQSILHNTADHYQQTQQELFRTDPGVGYRGIGGIGVDSEDINGIFNDSNDKLIGYHRWQIWRRQQMTFRGKLPKSLVIDGYQIYILPFNESKGSWYESKTYNFDISQVLKVKINPKMQNYFKIVVKKGDDVMVKKYYLEARNAKESKEIVATIKALASSYTM